MARRGKGERGNGRFGFFLALAALFFLGGFITAWLVWRREMVPPPAPLQAKKEQPVVPLPLPKTPPLERKIAIGRRLALVVDDIGGSREPVKRLLALGMPVTFAVLPGRTYTKELSQLIRDAGYELLIHMPMEPENVELNDPGVQALMVSQTEDEVRSLVRRQIAELPQATGVNNHMGSLFTRDEGKMRIVLEEVRAAGLFFVDSLTTPKSVGMPLARQLGVKCAGRRVFLDNDSGPEAIERSVRAAVKLAKAGNDVIAIGHPRPATIDAITSLKGELAMAGVEPVFVSELVR